MMKPIFTVCPQGVEKTKVTCSVNSQLERFFFDNAVQLRYAASYGQLAEGKNLYCFTAVIFMRKALLLLILI